MSREGRAVGADRASNVDQRANRLSDRVEMFGAARVQHGKGNDRVYIMDLGGEDAERVAREVERLAAQEGYGKLFAKVPAAVSPAFFALGWHLEAFVPNLFTESASLSLTDSAGMSADSAGMLPKSVRPSTDSARAVHSDLPEAEDGFFLVKYLSSERKAQAESGETRDLLCSFFQLVNSARPGGGKPMPSSILIRPCFPEDAGAMAELYKELFSDYPFPVDDPAFIIETMNAGTDYFCAVTEGGNRSGSDSEEYSVPNRIIALSSAERNDEYAFAEMTDFAVLPVYRGLGLSGVMLREMEKAVSEKGIRTAFTIARLNQLGMNATFLKAGYSYSGTLLANTAMPDGLESMNVLYKQLLY